MLTVDREQITQQYSPDQIIYILLKKYCNFYCKNTQLLLEEEIKSKKLLIIEDIFGKF